MNEFIEADNKYYERFGEMFPVLMFKGYSSKKLVAMINECLDKNEAIKPKKEKGVLY